MAATTHRNPSLSQAGPILQEALSKHQLLVIIGNCRVDYEGRASSTLEWGERLILVKTDGSVLVHRPAGYEPVNWQPPRCIFQVDVSEDALKLRAVRTQPQDVLTIFFNKIFEVTVSSLIDRGEFSLHVTEMDMKRAILTVPNLVEESFRPVSDEKNLGESGFVDVFGEDSKGNFMVVEIKRVPAGKEAVLQLERYVQAIKRKTERPIRGLVVAPDLRREAQPILASMKLEFKPLSLKKCSEVLRKAKTRRLTDFLG